MAGDGTSWGDRMKGLKAHGNASGGGGAMMTPSFTSDNGGNVQGYGYYNGGPGAPPQTGNSGVDSIMANRPGYLSPMDQNGNLYDQFKMKKNPSLMGNIQGGLANIDKSGVTDNFKIANGDVAKMNHMANMTGLTPYAQAQMQQLDHMKTTGLSDATASAGGANAAAMEQMQMHGGAGAGAQERMAKAGANNVLNARQDVYAHDASGRLGVGAQDANYKQGLLTNMPGVAAGLAGAENQVGMSHLGMWKDQANFEGQQNLGVQGQNIGTKLGAMGGENDFNQNIWGKGADVYGQGQVADAMTAQANKPNPGLLGGGGLLGTGLSSPADQWGKFSPAGSQSGQGFNPGALISGGGFGGGMQNFYGGY